MRSFTLVVVASLATLALAPAPAPARAAPNVELLALTVPGSGAFGVRVDTSETGKFALTLTTLGPMQGSRVALGTYLYDGERTFRMSMVGVGFESPERTIVRSSAPEGALPDGVTMSIHTGDGDGAAGGADGGCDVACLELRVDAAPLSRHYVVVWVGGVARTTLTVLGGEGARAVATVGEAVTLGDAEIRSGLVNVQAQRDFAERHGLGAKVVSGATIEVDVANALYGAWGQIDFKAACTRATRCVGPTVASNACVDAAGVDCAASAVSWTGPGGSGGSGLPDYAFRDDGPGAYAFTIDRKADAYNPGTVDGAGAVAYAAESMTFLAVADVALPE